MSKPTQFLSVATLPTNDSKLAEFNLVASYNGAFVRVTGSKLKEWMTQDMSTSTTIGNLTNRVSTLENTVGGHTSSISGINNSISTLTNRVSSTETKNSQQDGRITTLESWKNIIETWRSTAHTKDGQQDSKISALETWRAGVDSTNSSQSTDIAQLKSWRTTVNQKNSSQDSSISQLSARIDNLTAANSGNINSKVNIENGYSQAQMLYGGNERRNRVTVVDHNVGGERNTVLAFTTKTFSNTFDYYNASEAKITLNTTNTVTSLILTSANMRFDTHHIFSDGVLTFQANKIHKTHSAHGKTFARFAIYNDSTGYPDVIGYMKHDDNRNLVISNRSNQEFVMNGNGTITWMGQQIPFGDRLGLHGESVSNLNNATKTGWYRASSTAANHPFPNQNQWALIHVMSLAGEHVIQTARYGSTGAPGDRIFQRRRVGGTWTNWTTDQEFGAVKTDRVSAGWDSNLPGAISCNNWFRAYGQTGISFDSYGGGLYMTDGIYIRTTSNKGLAASEFAMTSDVRLKSDIRPLDYKGELKPVEYTLKADGSKHLGFIAQDVQSLDTRAVSENPNDGILSIDPVAITAILSAQVNQQAETIASLQKELESLRREMADIKAILTASR